MPYYAETNRRLDTLVANPLPRVTPGSVKEPGRVGEPADTIRAGWAKGNITPPKPISLAGYGNRLGRKYRGVRDSTYVRAFVFKNRRSQHALVAADMLIFPPALIKQLRKDLPPIGWRMDQLYPTATHTHNGSGGWAPRLVGRLIAGRYRRREVKRLSGIIVHAIRRAAADAEPVRLGFAQLDAADCVNNRLVGEAGTRDTLLNVLKLMKPSGETALITSFSAHATVLPSRNYTLSRDYPGALVDLLEENSSATTSATTAAVTMAAFCAGGVGSHSPRNQTSDGAGLDELADRLARKILLRLPEIETRYQSELRSLTVPLALRKPQWRLGRNVRLRPWVFYWLYGKYPASLTALQLGSTLWLGTPCDFSGELTAALRPLAAEKRLDLVVTSFNGGYVGYITKDEHYDRKHFETRAMNWFGPHNGAYLSKVMGRIIKGF